MSQLHEEVSRKMRDTAGGTPALPLKKRLLQSTIHDPRSTILLPLRVHSYLFAVKNSFDPISLLLRDLSVLAVNYSSKNRRREAASPYRVWRHEE